MTNCPAIPIRDRTLATARCGKAMVRSIGRLPFEKFSDHKSRHTLLAITWSKSADRSLCFPKNPRPFSYPRSPLRKVNKCIGLCLGSKT
jgi:hypothetical protein